MPPTDRVVPRFAAEPPQDLLPYGRWAATLRDHFVAACEAVDPDGEDVGTPESVVWFPDRSFAARTYVPATARTNTGFEFFGYVAYAIEGGEPRDFLARADVTDETADRHPEWRIDLNDDVVAQWRGEEGAAADMTLVWGIPLTRGGAVVTAELGPHTVDQCTLVEERFTLLAPDAYRGDTLEVALFDQKGAELARESLYEDDEDEESAVEDHLEE